MDNQLLSLILEELNGKPLNYLKDWKVFIKVFNKTKDKIKNSYNNTDYMEVEIDHYFRELLQTI